DRWDVALASSGPDAWQRVDVDDPAPDARPVPSVAVSDLEVGRDRIAFTVDEPGTPILVKASYFPSWRVSGADGPYRVAPNHMVVVPTGTEVTLTYGREPVEWLGYAMTLLGVILAILLARRGPIPMRSTDGADRTPPAHLPVADGEGSWVTAPGTWRAPESQGSWPAPSGPQGTGPASS
ncbi:MAG: hypothetical protein ACO1PW_14430, partial [Actinomycetota bacterium]